MLFFSVAETVTQRKRSDNFHCNISRSTQNAFGGSTWNAWIALLWALGDLFGHELTHRKSSAQIRHQERAARHLASRNRILAKDLRMRYQE
jgi:hypothetical protein